MRALVAHPGTQHAFRLAVELNRLNALSILHTGIALPSGGVFDWAIEHLPYGLRRLAANRRIQDLPHKSVHLQPFRELATLIPNGLGWDAQRMLHWRNKHFQQRIPTRDLEGSDVVIGFDTSTWILTRRCRKLGKPIVMVQTIGHPDSRKAVHGEIATRFPRWHDIEHERLPIVREAEREEHDAADVIVASSSFTHQTLIDNGVSPDKIRVIPHGVDCEQFSVSNARRNGPFRFVFAGAITARKGVPLLVEAWRRLRPIGAELVFIGPASRKARSLLPDLPSLRYLGAVPQSDLPLIFQQCDVFVFPSYFEGFGLVILQAMACGLPVITTNATAGPDLFRGGKGGWIIPSGSVEALTEAMNRCLIQRDDMRSAGRAARAIAEQFTWAKYAKRWLSLLGEVGRREESAFQATLDRREPAHLVAELKQLANTPRILLAHPGTQYSGRLATQLQRLGVLDQFRTCFAFRDESLAASVIDRLPGRLRRRFANREVFQVPPDRLHIRPWHELIALFALRFGEDEQKVLQWRNAAFQRSIPDAAIIQVDAVIGFDTSSWIIARRAREQGRPFMLDQSIAHPRFFLEVASRLRREFPNWKESIPVKPDELLVREALEHEDATRIVVPSRFVARTLQDNGVDPAKIRINPFGVDLQRYQPSAAIPPLKPLRFIFAGSLQARKGLPLLLRAWSSLDRRDSAELLIAGGGKVPPSVRGDIPDSVRFLGRVPASELSRWFQQCHVFVFPSYFEGLAQVQIEAAACGLPVIGTDSSGCEEIIRHGETGFIIPTGDIDALRETLANFIANPEIALPMRDRLLAERSSWSWDAYGERWVDLINEVVIAKTTSDRSSVVSCL